MTEAIGRSLQVKLMKFEVKEEASEKRTQFLKSELSGNFLISLQQM